MRKVYLLIFAGMLALNAEAKKVKGVIINKNDTLHVTMIIPVSFFTQVPQYIKLQNKVRYIDSNGIKVTLLPGAASEIQFNYLGEDVRMISKPFHSTQLFANSSVIFMKLEVDGYLKLFSHYYIVHSMNGTNGTMTSQVVHESMLQRGNSSYEKVKGLYFRKAMINYFRDCPELTNKIENRVFRKSDIHQIVKFYNSQCK